MRKKINFGTGIVIAILVFTTTVAIMVFTAMNRDVDLVNEDYYANELRHQSRIESTKRTQVMKEPVTVRVSTGYVDIGFPATYDVQKISGSILLYRPSSHKKDIQVPISVDEKNQQRIPTSTLDPGLWRVKIQWTYEQLDYYREEVVVL